MPPANAIASMHAKASALPSAASIEVRRLTDVGGSEAAADWVAVEAPLELRIGNIPATVLMRTPGHDDELVSGFLFNEGVIHSQADIQFISEPHPSPEEIGGSVIDVRLSPECANRTLDRAFYSNASCGVCGKKSIAALEVKGALAGAAAAIPRDVLLGLPDRLRSTQTVFAQTGGVHASGLFTPEGELITLREDVGRHNALDKIVGWALRADRLPLSSSEIGRAHV